MTPSESLHRLLPGLNLRHRLCRWSPALGALSGALGSIIGHGTMVFDLLAAAAAAILGGLIGALVVRRAGIVLTLNGDVQRGERFRTVVQAFNHLASCPAVWQIRMSFRTRSGPAAGDVVRDPVRLGIGTPLGIRSELAIPALLAPGMSLHFLPDGLLVHDRWGFALIDYQSLVVDADAVSDGGEAASGSLGDRHPGNWEPTGSRGTPGLTVLPDPGPASACHHGLLSLYAGNRLHLQLATSDVLVPENCVRTLGVTVRPRF